VIEKNLLVTRVRTTKNVDITIPNSVVLASHITNYSTSHSLIIHTSVSIGYNVPWQMVHELLLAAARKTKGILSQPPPFVQQKALNDLAVAYEINAYIESPSGMGMIYSDLHTNIQDTFHAAGVEIMSPAVMALRDGNEAALPPDYPPGSHEPPRQSGTVDAQ
jgi:small-conductance mechanosensitive channel